MRPDLAHRHARRTTSPRTGDHTFAAAAAIDRAFAWALISSTILLAWLLTYVAGGSKTALPHAFYLSVVIAAVRFGPRGALTVALAAGIVAGPLTPQDVDAGAAQSIANWMPRLLFFVLVGQMTALLVRRSLPSITDELATRTLRADVASAVSGDQLRLEYQPIIDLRTGAVVGAEALLRWRHPERGDIPPCDFIARAEAAGCIHQLTRWVIDHACAQLAEWHRTVLSDRTSFKFAINLSAADLGDPELVTFLERVIERTGIPPTWLHLEVTETALVKDVDTAIHGLAALSGLGVRLAIDDFGAGESSLGQLGRLPVHGIKIDRSFLQEIEGQEHGEVLFGGIIALARAMDVTTVAEGIETTAQADIVRRSGCDLAQGYLFARPVDAAAVAARFAGDSPAAWQPDDDSDRSWWPSRLTQDP